MRLRAADRDIMMWPTIAVGVVAWLLVSPVLAVVVGRSLVVAERREAESRRPAVPLIPSPVPPADDDPAALADMEPAPPTRAPVQEPDPWVALMESLARDEARDHGRNSVG